MGFSRMSQWMVLALIPIYLVTGCGDLEPEMQDTRTVILNMDFHGKSSSRSSSSVSASELSQYYTHLILALPSWENLTSSYKNYYSSFAQGLMNTADKKVSLEIPLNTQMKIFAFLFKESYSMSELFSGVREVGYYGKSQSFSIGTNTNSLSLGITLQSKGTTNGDSGGEDGGNDGGSDDYGNTTTTELEGTWVSSCYSGWDNNYVIQSITVTGSALVIKWDEHSDSSCVTDYAIWTDTHSSFYIGNESTLDNDSTGRKYTMKVDSLEVLMQTAAAAIDYNNYNFCGDSDYSLNTTKDYSGKTCAGVDYQAANTSRYGIYVLDGSSLLFSYSNSDNVSSVGSRVYTKQ